MANSVFLPNYTIGTDAYDAIGAICHTFGTKVAIIGGQTALEKSIDKIKASLAKTDFILTDVQVYGDDATYEHVERLQAIPTVQEADLIFAVGGGRAVDTVKTLAERMAKPVFTFPTIASNCAPNTAVSVMYKATGEMDGLFFLNAPPKHCFIDTEIIAEAPSVYLWAGIADAISKEYESAFSSRGKTLAYTDALGVQVAQNSADRLMTYGKDALDSCTENKTSFALEQVALDILMTTALTSVLVDNDYNSNAAHSFYYGSTVVEGCESHLHGEIVCYGVLLLLTMDGQIEARNRLYDFMRRVDLSVSLEQIGVKNEEEVERILDKALTTVDIDCSPYPITKELYKQAIADLEAYHQTQS